MDRDSEPHTRVNRNEERRKNIWGHLKAALPPGFAAEIDQLTPVDPRSQKFVQTNDNNTSKATASKIESPSSERAIVTMNAVTTTCVLEN